MVVHQGDLLKLTCRQNYTASTDESVTIKKGEDFLMPTNSGDYVVSSLLSTNFLKAEIELWKKNTTQNQYQKTGKEVNLTGLKTISFFAYCAASYISTRLS